MLETPHEKKLIVEAYKDAYCNYIGENNLSHKETIEYLLEKFEEITMAYLEQSVELRKLKELLEDEHDI